MSSLMFVTGGSSGIGPALPDPDAVARALRQAVEAGLGNRGVLDLRELDVEIG